MLRSLRSLLAIPLMLVVACSSAPAAPTTGQSSAPQPSAPTTPKRLTISVVSEPVGFHLAVETQRISLVQAGLAYFLFPGLTVYDDQGALHATLGEAVPSVENGLWKVFPDGRMETTHPIRQGAQWHDGTPLTGDDLAFTLDVVRDKELPEFRQNGIDLIESFETGPRSVTVTWKQP